MTNELNNNINNQSTNSSFSSCEESETASALSAHTNVTTPETIVPPVTTSWLSQPSEHDIVCGRGKSISAHAGNLRFRHMILARRDEYQATFKRDDKSRITAEIVEALRTGPFPSRFLIKDTETDLYREVDTEYAREKVSHALRSRLSSSKKKKKNNKKRSLMNVQSIDASPSRPKLRRPCGEWSNEEEAQIQMLIREQQELLRTFLQR